MTYFAMIASYNINIVIKDPECTQPKWQLVPYFCGQDPRCRKKEQWAVDKAKENIEQYYVAVGIGICIFVG